MFYESILIYVEVELLGIAAGNCEATMTKIYSLILVLK